jgi:hypothetical protein
MGTAIVFPYFADFFGALLDGMGAGKTWYAGGSTFYLQNYDLQYVFYFMSYNLYRNIIYYIFLLIFSF